MKKQVFLIHGGDSFSDYQNFLHSLRSATIRNLPGSEKIVGWSETLSTDLGEMYEVFKPAMPNKQNAQYEEWKIWFERHFEYLREDVVLVGWSLGGMFLAKYLSENDSPLNIKAVFLLAAPCGACADETGNDCGTFQFLQEKLNKLANQVKKVEIWHSKDDFVVPYQHALVYKQYLPEATLATFEDKNHFLVPEFPELVNKIKAL